jgi:hypothetical protein
VDNSLAEQVFDTLSDTPMCYFPHPACASEDDTPSTRQRHARTEAARSASLFGDVEGSAHGSPYPLGVDPRLQRPVHRPAAELCEHMIMSQRRRSSWTELLVHPLPEVGDPHESRLGTGCQLS